MAIRSAPVWASARLTLRAHHPSPARVELSRRTVPDRAARTVLWLVLFWSVPLLVGAAPHRPWVVASLGLGVFLAHREWTARYRVRAFAGICPRCGRHLSPGARNIDLPHRLSCYRCHFEPVLEVGLEPEEGPVRPEHRAASCTGRWTAMWLADQPYVVCGGCGAHAPADERVRAEAMAENERSELLERLADDGRWMI